MCKNNSKKKMKIHCPLCNRLYIKQYISEHIRNTHKNDEYCNIVSRGIVYKKFNSNKPLFKKNTEFFCSLCQKTIKAKSKYAHLNSKIHIIFKNKISNTIGNKKNYEYIQQKCFDYNDNIILNQKLQKENFDESISNYSITNLENGKANHKNGIITKSRKDKNNKINSEESESLSILKNNKPNKSQIKSPLIINNNETKNIYNSNNNDVESVGAEKSILSESSSLDWWESESIKSLGNGGFFDWIKCPNHKEIEKEIDIILKRIEDKKNFNKDLLKWRDRERKKNNQTTKKVKFIS